MKCLCGERDAEWKGTPTRVYRKEYPHEKWLFCGDCMEGLFACMWSGGGPFPSDFKSFKRVKESG
jgi:hypothetical protein